MLITFANLFSYSHFFLPAILPAILPALFTHPVTLIGSSSFPGFLFNTEPQLDANSCKLVVVSLGLDDCPISHSSICLQIVCTMFDKMCIIACVTLSLLCVTS